MGAPDGGRAESNVGGAGEGGATFNTVHTSKQIQGGGEVQLLQCVSKQTVLPISDVMMFLTVLLV